MNMANLSNVPVERKSHERLSSPDDAILEIRNLKVYFGDDDQPRQVRAVDDVTFHVRKGATLCVVGESGSGKSVTARAILGLTDHPGRVAGGQILLHDNGRSAPLDLAALDNRGKDIRSIRGKEIAMIFQEPMTSLSPVHTIGAQIVDMVMLHKKVTRKEAHQRAIELLRSVEIPDPERAINRYTFEYSGGMRQRAMIAMALSCSPRVLIADEPTTALDVTTQAEILALIKRMQEELGMSVIFITHDMGVVAEIADEIAVMRHGKLLEFGPAAQIFDEAQHSYTRELIDSVRKLETSARNARSVKRSSEVVLAVRNLSKVYGGRKRGFSNVVTGGIHAVKDVSFDLHLGENLGIVGESGSGKSTLGNCLMRILTPTSGTISYTNAEGHTLEVTSAGQEELRKYHRDARIVFQDPFASLNPRMTIGQIIGEPLLVTGLVPGRVDRRKRVAELLKMVGLPEQIVERYPHAFSGGQRQRISIARALALDPRLIVADEATSALDVTLRSQILDLMLDLQEELGLSYILISHDLGVIRYFCDRVAVMYRGEMVEVGTAEKISRNPDHGYTQALLSAAPCTHPSERRLMHRHRYTAG